MKGKLGSVGVVLRPILDTYMDSAVALVGCNSRGIGRYSCEYDVVVVGEKRSSTSFKVGEEFVDVVFITDGEALEPSSPEHAMSLASARPIRDTSLVLSTASAACEATLGESAVKASRIRLARAVKTFGRAEVALAKGARVDADFWLLASSNEFAYAWLLSRETLPSPSHLLSQLRSISKVPPGSFEGISAASGLGAAGRAGCGARLEGLMVLHDLLREGTGSQQSRQEWSALRTECMSAKANELITRIELAECYSYLGQEVMDGVMELLRRHPKRTLTSLSASKDRLVGERLMKQLGLARGDKALRTGLEGLKGQINLLAKRA